MHAAPPSFPPADPAACFSSRARSRPPPQIAAGEPWGDALPTRAEDGTLDAGVATFALTYTLLVTWTLLPISLAVLVDNFTTVSARATEEKRAQLIHEAKMASQVRRDISRSARRSPLAAAKPWRGRGRGSWCDVVRRRTRRACVQHSRLPLA